MRGAFGSGDPASSFTVVVDDSNNNNTAEIAAGQLNVAVTFYPSRPAETIVISIGQQDKPGRLPAVTRETRCHVVSILRKDYGIGHGSSLTQRFFVRIHMIDTAEAASPSGEQVAQQRLLVGRPAQQDDVSIEIEQCIA